MIKLVSGHRPGETEVFGPVIELERCTRCGICDIFCPGDIIFMDVMTNLPVVEYPEECFFCGICERECPEKIVKLVFPQGILHFQGGV